MEPRMQHVHALIIFGIIFSLIPIPFYAMTAISASVSYFAAGAAIQLAGAALILSARYLNTKMNGMEHA